jgi:hypothetical protein
MASIEGAVTSHPKNAPPPHAGRWASRPRGPLRTRTTGRGKLLSLVWIGGNDLGCDQSAGAKRGTGVQWKSAMATTRLSAFKNRGPRSFVGRFLEWPSAR